MKVESAKTEEADNAAAEEQEEKASKLDSEEAPVISEIGQPENESPPHDDNVENASAEPIIEEKQETASDIEPTASMIYHSCFPFFINIDRKLHFAVKNTAYSRGLKSQNVLVKLQKRDFYKQKSLNFGILCKKHCLSSCWAFP